MKKIIYNCKKATFLIEKKQITNLNMHEKLELQLHRSCCSMCRIFERQSITINKLVHDLVHKPQVTESPGLDNAFKEKTKRLIMKELGKI